MSKGSTSFRCEIFTPDGPVTDCEVVGAVLPARDGYLGVLANRAPLTAVVGTGRIKLEISPGQVEEWFLSRGFLRVRDNHLRVLAEECCRLAELDPEEAWEQLQQAYKLPRETAEQEALRDEAVQAGRIKFALAQKLRKSQEGERSPEDILAGGL